MKIMWYHWFFIILGQVYFLALFLRLWPLVVNTRNLMGLMPESWTKWQRFKVAIPNYFIPECLGAMAMIWMQRMYAFSYAPMPELYQIMLRVVGPEALQRAREKEKQDLTIGEHPAYNRQLQVETPDEILAQLKQISGCNQLQNHMPIEGIAHDTNANAEAK